MADSDSSRFNEKKTNLKVKLYSASAGALLTVFAVTPLDVVKTRMQTELEGKPMASVKSASVRTAMNFQCTECGSLILQRRQLCKISNILCQAPSNVLWPAGGGGGPVGAGAGAGVAGRLRALAAAGGARALWAGLGPALAGNVPAVACYMVAYDLLHEAGCERLGMATGPAALAAGGAARTLVTLIFNPLELIKTRLQAGLGVRGLLGAAAASGWGGRARALWRGTSATLLRDVSYSMVYWLGYEALKERWSAERKSFLPPALVPFASASTSAMVTSCLNHPFDVIKTQQQVAEPIATQTQPTVYNVGRAILIKEGMPGLYRGLAPRLMRNIPSSAIMISSYEYGKSLLK